MSLVLLFLSKFSFNHLSFEFFCCEESYSFFSGKDLLYILYILHHPLCKTHGKSRTAELCLPLALSTSGLREWHQWTSCSTTCGDAEWAYFNENRRRAFASNRIGMASNLIALICKNELFKTQTYSCIFMFVRPKQMSLKHDSICNIYNVWICLKKQLANICPCSTLKVRAISRECAG